MTRNQKKKKKYWLVERLGVQFYIFGLMFKGDENLKMFVERV